MSSPFVIRYPESLPVSQRKEEIAELIRNHPVVIVAGETGSGKTTQLPKICLELGRGRAGIIGHTQPRRVAASSVAARIAEELEVPLGKEVGFQVRFTDTSSKETLLKLMTDGVLLAEIVRDRLLKRYDTLIIDEAHERSLNIDFLLGYLKRILPQRPDLKVIITSATIDIERFSRHFDNAPTIVVSGRSYPVEVLYRPPEQNEEGEWSLSQAVLQTLREIEERERAAKGAGRGDVLVFLPGERDIREISHLLRKEVGFTGEVLPLYARLSIGEQRRIFEPGGKRAGRRVVLATNVAETSLTVPGIRYVIDSGLARISRYSHRSKIQRLPVERIAQASASQRAGRCGRVAAGICYRLYSEEDFLGRELFTVPEIQRTNLSAVILQMMMMGLGDIENFPFLDPPDSRLVNDGFRQLAELAALDEKRRLTTLGRKLGQLPLDPRLARILVQASREHALAEVLVMVAALSIQDVRETPADKREAAREKHQRFADEHSDFAALFNLWNYLETQRQELGSNAFRKMCGREFLSFLRVREWRETHAQLKRICQEIGLRENDTPAGYDAIHRALLSGFLVNIGFQKEPKVFEGTRNRKFAIFPGSFQAKKPPKWLMAAELIETSQLFAHQVAKIDPAWLRELGAHLLRFSYSEPHWSIRNGQVMAYETATLYGLVIGERREVGYSKISPEESRAIFIRAALVEGQVRTQAPFFRHNEKLRNDLLEIENRTRRRDILVSDDAVYAFYDARIPADVSNLAGFDRWRSEAEKKEPKLLFASEADFQAVDAGFSGAAFPDLLEWNGVNYRLRYRFEPGHAEDGVSVELPVSQLNRLPACRFEWMVPGLLAEKCEALIRTLPKNLRRNLVPVPDHARQLAARLVPADRPLAVALAEAIRKEKGVLVPADAFRPDEVDDYYRMNFRLLDENGKLLESTRDLRALLARHGHRVQQMLEKKTASQPEKKSYTAWEFGDLPATQSFRQNGVTVVSWPAVRDEGDKVSVVLTDFPHVQAGVHRQGVIRLAALALPQQVRYLHKELLKGNDLQMKLPPGFTRDKLLHDLVDAAILHACFAEGVPFAQKEFVAKLESGRTRLVETGQRLEKLVRQLLEEDYQVRRQLAALTAPAMQEARADMESQRAALLYPGFLVATEAEWLFELPRYFRALVFRIERLPQQLVRDTQQTREITLFLNRRQQLVKEFPQAAYLPALQAYRWMIEEYRVSLFAQQLKTRVPVSAKRLEKEWQCVQDEKQNNFSLR